MNAEATLGRRSFLDRSRDLAESPTAPRLCFVWAFLEGFAWPLIPELILVPLVFVAPRRGPALVASTIAGSVCGGLLAYVLSLTALGPILLERVWFVTNPMRDAAAAWLGESGALGLLHQPLSGVPYKTFGLQAGSYMNPFEFLALSVLTQGGRMVAVTVIAGTLGWLLGHFERALRILLPALAILYTAAFLIGLLIVQVLWTDWSTVL
jgi:1-acyl-sn-glycerol-3-phosphate acyltransferase